MKKLLLIALTLTLVLTSVAVAFADSTDPVVTTLNASGTKTKVTVSGTSKYCYAVAFQIKDNAGNVIKMFSCQCESDNDYVDGTFRTEISASLEAGKTYTLRAANFDGGAWKTITFTVPYDSYYDGGVTTVKKTVTNKDHPFTDVLKTAWYQAAVQYCYENGLINGVSLNLFSPERNITRQEIWMILARKGGASPATFDDAKAWVIANGISDGTNAAKAITREEAMTMIYRYEQKLNKGGFTGTWMYLLSYTDRNSISDWAYEGVAWLSMKNVAGGYTDETVRPSRLITRAEAAALMMRYCRLGE